MTYEKLGELIAAMTPEQRAKPALIPIKETGETAEITELSGGFTEDENQVVLWHNG
jgi:hypothetical protein